MPEYISKKLIQMHDEAKQEESRLIKEGKLETEKGLHTTSITNVENNLRILREAKERGDKKKADQMEQLLDQSINSILNRESEKETKKILDYVDMVTVDRYFREKGIDMEKIPSQKKEDALNKMKALIGNPDAKYGYFLEGQTDKEFQSLIKAEKNGLQSILRVFEGYLKKNPELFDSEKFQEMQENADKELQEFKDEAQKKFNEKKQELEKKYGNTPAAKSMINTQFDKMRKEITDKKKGIFDSLDETKKGRDQMIKAFLEYQKRFQDYVGEKEEGAGEVNIPSGEEEQEAA